MTDNKLLPCPFCGGKTYSQKLPFQPDIKYFRCGREALDRSIIDGTGCGAILSFVGEQGNVPTEKFNTRTATARIAELEAQLANTIVTDNSAVIDSLNAKLARVEALAEEANRNGGDRWLCEDVLEALRGE